MRRTGLLWRRWIDPKELENKRNYFGIHKIFKCVYKYIDEPSGKTKCSLSDYAFIFFFWFFGVFVFNANSIFDHHLEILQFKKECTGITYSVFGMGISLSLFVAFQIIFTCWLTPFIIIAIFYPKFFERIGMFFAMGQSSETMNEVYFF